MMHKHSDQPAPESQWADLTLSLWVIAALMAEIEIACWFFARMYGG
jgi:hypothetical protein